MLALLSSGTIWAQTAGTLKWEYVTASWPFGSPTLATDGSIYITTWAFWPGLYAVNPDGTEKWVYLPGWDVQATPAIAPDGTAYFGLESQDWVHAVRPDGTRRWRAAVEADSYASPAIARDGTVYFGTEWYSENNLYAFNPDGTLEWTRDTGGHVYSSPAIASDGTIYVASDDMYLDALNPDGSLRWRFEFATSGSGSDFASSPAIAADGSIFIGSQNRNLYAINPDGSLRWTYFFGSPVFASPVIGPDGAVFVGTNNGIMNAINPDGTLRWQFPTGDSLRSSSAVGSDGAVYFATAYSGTLYCVDAGGTLQWTFPVGECYMSSPLIGPDGTVYIGGFRSLYAIHSDSPGPAHSPWPMFRQNVRRTGRSERYLTPLSIGETVQTIIPRYGVHDYSLDTIAGESLLVTVEPGAGATGLVLSSQAGTLAQTSDSPAASGHYELLITPTVESGYVLSVFGADVDENGGDYSITANYVTHHASEVEPQIAGNFGEASVVISGLGFVDPMQVQLTGPGSLSAFSTTTASPTELLARFDLAAAPTGIYDLTVTWPDATWVTLSAAFEVVPGTGPEYEAHLRVPEGVRAARQYVAWLEYANTGDTDLPAPLFTVRSNTSISLDPDQIDRNRVEILGVGGPTDPSVLHPGESRRVPVYFMAPGSGMAEFELFETIDDSQPINWADHKDEMRPPDMDPSLWDIIWPDLIARLGVTWSDYLDVLRSDASRLQRAGRRAYDVGQIIALEVGLATGDPVTTISGTLRNAASYEPLAGITVRLRSTDGSSIAETETSYAPPGYFLFEEVADGDYELWIDGYYVDPVPSVFMAGSDITGVELLAHEYDPAPVLSEEEIPQHAPSITMDDAGVAYMVWQEGPELRSAINTAGVWTDAGPIPGAEGSMPTVVWDATLLDGGTSPGLFAAWQSGGPVSTIQWSLGRPVGGDIQWTTPESLTSDMADDVSIIAFVSDLNEPVVLWLQRDYTIADDTDLYFTVIPPPPPLSPLVLPGPKSSSYMPGEWPFCSNPGLQVMKELPPNIPFVGGHWGWKVIGSGCDALTSCNPLISPNWTIKVPLGSLTNFNATAAFRFQFNTEPCECKYLLNEARISAQNVGVNLSVPVYAVPLIAGDVPLGIATLAVGIGATLNGNLTWHSNFPILGASEGVLGLGVGYAIEGKVNFFFGLDGTVTGSATIYWSQSQPDYDIKFTGECVRLLGVAAMGYGLVSEPYCIQWGSSCPPQAGCPDSPPPIEEMTYQGPNGLASLGSETEMLDDQFPVAWQVEYVKDPLIGTGSTYEGAPVLGDISGDIYTDGPPEVAASGTSEYLAAWAKAEEAHVLGAKVWASSFNGTTWLTPVAITPATNLIKDPAVVFDSAGEPIAVWSEASNAGLDFDTSPVEDILAAIELADIFFSRRIGGVWTAPSLVAAPAGRDEQPAIAADATGAAALAWLNQSADGGWTLFASLWNGSTWSSPAAVATPPIAYRPRVFYQGGQPILLWTQPPTDEPQSVSGWRLYSSTWDGVVWSDPTPVEPQAPPDLPPAPLGETEYDLQLPDPPPQCCLESCDDPLPVDPPPVQQDELETASVPVVASNDPNEKVGPAGVGDGHFIAAGDPLDYVVYFENLPAASAPAQEVFVTDCLAYELDWNSATLTEVAFGEVVIANPGQHGVFNARVTVPDHRPAVDRDWWVEMSSHLDLATGCVEVVFRTLDPDTGELPDDPFAGFLPPEDGTGRGQGHIAVSADSKPDLVDGTVITNRASIIFDINDSIITNEVFNTIGDLEPTLPFYDGFESGDTSAWSRTVP